MFLGGVLNKVETEVPKIQVILLGSGRKLGIRDLQVYIYSIITSIINNNSPSFFLESSAAHCRMSKLDKNIIIILLNLCSHRRQIMYRSLFKFLALLLACQMRYIFY